MAKKTKSEGKSEVLVVPEHGRGLIKQGGDHPRPGRPPAAIRGSLREILEKGLDNLESIALGKGDVKHSDQIRALEVAARYGLQVTVDKQLVDEIWEACELHVPEEYRPKLKREINKILGRKLAEAVMT